MVYLELEFLYVPNAESRKEMRLYCFIFEEIIIQQKLKWPKTPPQKNKNQ